MKLVSAAGTPLTASSASSTAVPWRSLQELEVYGSAACTSEERGKDVRPAKQSKPHTLRRASSQTLMKLITEDFPRSVARATFRAVGATD